MDSLCDDVIIHLFQYIDEVYNLSLVCKQFKCIFNYESVIWYHYINNKPNYVELAETINNNNYTKYKLCYAIQLLTNKFKLSGSPLTVYNYRELKLYDNQIKKIPKE